MNMLMLSLARLLQIFLNLLECCNKHITSASHFTDLEDAMIHESIKEGKIQI